MSDGNDRSLTPSSEWETVARAAAVSKMSGNDEAPELLRELLVFGLDSTAYGLPVERVREIVRMRPLTRVPRAPTWLLGVVALRGEIVEVVDLRARIGLTPADAMRSSRIIVLHGDAERVTGILVDSVSEVFRVPESSIIQPHGSDIASVVEMCQRDDEFISILDIDRAVGSVDE